MDNRQYLQMFFDESSEYLQLLNENVLLLEGDPENEEVINAVFRAAHSVKGMSATMGFTKLTDLTHKVENILSKVRNKELHINEEIINLLFAGLDHIKELIEDIKNNGEEISDVSDYLNQLDDFLNRDQNSGQASLREVTAQEYDFTSYLSLSEEEQQEIAQKIKEQDVIYNIEVVLDESCLLKNVRGYMILKKAQELGYLAKSYPTLKEIEDEDFGLSIYFILVSSMFTEDMEEILKDIVDVKEVILEPSELTIFPAVKEEEAREDKQKSPKSLANIQVAPTVRVDINKLDLLMNMVGELLINKTRLEGLKISSEIYQDIIQQLDRVTMELHHIVMQIRMVPIGGIFNRFPRMVRDLSKELTKEIELVVEGADTELDRSIIDELGDPLMHLIRNAIDHGIEHPVEREKKGKSSTGTILLNAYQKGSEIIIEVEDDGAGIDPDFITRKALKKGLVTTEEVENMDDKEKLYLIFHPGFSTSEEVTDLSGRGVGMDVVKRVVESLDGQVFIESEQDLGTRFIISLPLTLAITQALMVKIDQEIFAIPLGAISETLMINPNDIRQVRGQDVIVLRDTTIPIVEGSCKLNLNVEYGKYTEREEISVVIITSGERQVGLIVDELLNQQEIVIKSLGNYLVNTKNISGATIVGDGDVALILDVRNIA